MLKTLKEKINNIKEQMGNASMAVANLRNNQNEML